MRGHQRGRPAEFIRQGREYRLAEETPKSGESTRGLYTLAMVNAGVWAVAMIALVFVIQRAPSAKGLFVILAAGVGVSVSLVSAIGRSR